MPTRPDLDGLLIRLDHDPNLYLVDQGRARSVPNDEVFREWLFAAGAKVWTLALDIDKGVALSRGEVLEKTNSSPAVYWDGALGVRHIADPQTLRRYNFNTERIQVAPIKPTPTAQEVKWVPWFSGNRVKVPSEPPIYLIDRGKRRHITDMGAYQRLFGNSQPQSIDSVSQIIIGAPIGPDARLIKGDMGPQVYFYDPGGKFPTKRHIVDMNTMSYYGFAFGTVETRSQWSVDEIPDGERIVWPDTYVDT